MRETASFDDHRQQNMEDIADNFDFPEKGLSVSQYCGKKLRLREDIKKKIKERLREKRTRARDFVHKEFLHVEQEKDLLLLGNNETVRISRLDTIIKQLWKIYPVSLKLKSKGNSLGHAPCYLWRNIKTVDKSRRSAYVKHISPKRKRKRKSLCFRPKIQKEQKARIETKHDFYFRFKKNHAVLFGSSCQYMRINCGTSISNLSEKVPEVSTSEISSSKSEMKCDSLSNFTFKRNRDKFGSSFPKRTEETAQPKCTETSTLQRWHIPLFSNRPVLWKSVIKEHDEYRI